MPNRLFQRVIHQMKDAVNGVIGVIDETGAVIACSDLSRIGEIRQGIKEELSYSSESITSGGFTYRAIGSATKTEYIVFAEGEGKEADRTAMLISIALSNIKNLYDEKYDKTSFIKNIILDNILPSDIINVGEHDIVLVKEVKPGVDIREIEKQAKNICDTIYSEFFAKVAIGIGTPVDNIKDLARSYKEAQVALEVGKVFDTDKNVNSYENLGIGRLIYQLPTTLCEMFLHEVFKDDSIDFLDRETLMTIQCFFDNNLNVSETSRKLFVHRNTLVYRLEKIKKLTGLDLREFDNAITFKVALMVKRYLVSKPAKF